MTMIVDPRRGDVEDDASSPKARSMLSLAGSLLVEISLPKLIAAWLILLVFPAILLGLAPLVASAWVKAVAGKIVSPYVGIMPILLLLAVVALGAFFWRPFYQLAEKNFWSLNALAVEPAYAMGREALRHVTEAILPDDAEAAVRGRLRAVAGAVSGALMSGTAFLVAMLVWPYTRWIGEGADVLHPRDLALVALANGIVLICAYLVAAALAWALADVTMAYPRDLQRFRSPTPGARTWRIAHLSDVHVVGERYGYRIECGRSGPRGNTRLKRALALLEEIHAAEPLDTVLISGDMTDAGRAAEWAEFLDALSAVPGIAERTLILPGNHDINIVDRANPARFDLPTTPNRRLRKIRALSVTNLLQGSRVHVVDRKANRVGKTLADALKPHMAEMTKFADAGKPHFSAAVTELWNDVFPMVVPPDGENSLGIVLLNTNADSHFSFTNALGMIPADQISGIEIAIAQYPRACWLIALHHHVVEYPRPAKVLSERIGTALVNSNAFVRRLQSMASHAVLMHGHRHIDWIGECGGLVIVSAPSPVMGSTDDHDSYFYIHTLVAGSDGSLGIGRPQRVTVRGEPTSKA